MLVCGILNIKFCFTLFIKTFKHFTTRASRICNLYHTDKKKDTKANPMSCRNPYVDLTVCEASIDTEVELGPLEIPVKNTVIGALPPLTLNLMDTSQWCVTLSPSLQIAVPPTLPPIVPVDPPVVDPPVVDPHVVDPPVVDPPVVDPPVVDPPGDIQVVVQPRQPVESVRSYANVTLTVSVSTQTTTIYSYSRTITVESRPVLLGSTQINFYELSPSWVLPTELSRGIYTVQTTVSVLYDADTPGLAISGTIGAVASVSKILS